MLEHEPQETPAPQTFTAQIPAADRRVSAAELTRAVSALEDAKAAERVAGVAPIGQVVDELGLDLTPEEIWAQVQKQRAQKAAEEQAKQMPVITPPAAVFQTPPRPHRPRWWIAWAAVLVFGGVGYNAVVQRAPTRPASGPTIVIGGEDQSVTIPVQGKDVVVEGEDNIVTLIGQARSVTLSGQDNKVRGDKPKTFVPGGENNSAKWNNAP